MRILPSWSSGMNANVGSTSVVDDLEVEPVALGDRAQYATLGAAERVDAERSAGARDRVEVDDGSQVVDVAPSDSRSAPWRSSMRLVVAVPPARRVRPSAQQRVGARPRSAR